MAKKVVEAVKAKFGDAIVATDSHCGDETITVKREKLVAVATFLRDDPAMAFDVPVFVTCVDLLDWQPLGRRGAPDDGTRPAFDSGAADAARFEVNFQLRSLTHRHRIRLKVAVKETDAKVPSLTPLWAGFNWQERETFDMYGIRFDGHPDLRRIYLYDEFVGYPLRKDYPKDKRQPLVRRPDLVGDH
ncbi:MAG: NADH-quinone oxidoreductase subunit C [Kofleriaceae bacterium]|jgi:NADH-quinone oxidoreductase subunit C|nr:NADH-quinone oxidoreductase subunit C [Kofleriaceae bacterium]MBP9169783.1 NADH-quinone oxidoreductase subunit C [Kofleriaceae bacterium]MBP9858126.1 NADH-quinone oxidoreductase subunit C [Kofleriaceae bacterium]